MNEEISHIAQWQELMARANNFALGIDFDSNAFYLYGPNAPGKGNLLGQYLTLADLRAGISDYVAGERAAGRLNR